MVWQLQIFLAVHGINPTTKISSTFNPISFTQCFLIVEQIIAYGERAVEIFGINYGYFVSTKLIQAGQHDV